MFLILTLQFRFLSGFFFGFKSVFVQTQIDEGHLCGLTYKFKLVDIKSLEACVQRFIGGPSPHCAPFPAY